MPGAANQSVERMKQVDTPSVSTASPAPSQHPGNSLLYAQSYQGIQTHYHGFWGPKYVLDCVLCP